MASDHVALSAVPVIVRQAFPPDLVYVMSLMRANRESVGGLPAPAILERIQRGTVLLAEINDDPVGYVLYDLRDGILRIPQACIQYDARRRKYGEALVARMMQRHGESVREVNLRCAADLEANVFWRDMGFTCVGTVPGGKRRGRTINVWTMWLEPRLLTLDDLAVVPAAELRQDSMYDDSGFLTRAPDGFRKAVLLPKLAWSNRKRSPRLTARTGVDGTPPSRSDSGVADQVYDPFGAAPPELTTEAVS